MLKETNQPIGMCGITKRDFLEYPDLGFAFLDEFTGNGYAFEITAKMCQQLLLSQSTISLITNNHNLASIKLAHKLQFQFVKTYYELHFLADISVFILSNNKKSLTINI
ncbi:GNAT family N-acetyltransferase [Rhizosphaericola mali]|uniref:GNAT family N-acetyltransferase n=1 Tax=Rhizosphaericola mali TaxID=2545455 RepID=A0A5P2G9H8_9BACT|nr:GNAT family N-acetyltransferase [Rhizosphaericola mali]